MAISSSSSGMPNLEFADVVALKLMLVVPSEAPPELAVHGRLLLNGASVGPLIETLDGVLIRSLQECNPGRGVSEMHNLCAPRDYNGHPEVSLQRSMGESEPSVAAVSNLDRPAGQNSG